MSTIIPSAPAVQDVMFEMGCAAGKVFVHNLPTLATRYTSLRGLPTNILIMTDVDTGAAVPFLLTTQLATRNTSVDLEHCKDVLMAQFETKVEELMPQKLMYRTHQPRAYVRDNITRRLTTPVDRSSLRSRGCVVSSYGRNLQTWMEVACSTIVLSAALPKTEDEVGFEPYISKGEISGTLKLGGQAGEFSMKHRFLRLARVFDVEVLKNLLTYEYETRLPFMATVVPITDIVFNPIEAPSELVLQDEKKGKHPAMIGLARIERSIENEAIKSK